MAKPAQAGPAVASRRHQQGGFCEICESPFTDLYDHISSRYLIYNLISLGFRRT